ncbi:ABC transporter ATP-binding protein [Cryobacterium frigoriphilum]|uniref:ABC-type quaternary amine transporter n=1 Tax=Cryobacterium frigoriphilum TaxID=1259150 RepID=A0A4R9A9Q9_9MICO|nr:ABC transporter ATP-binding protein [Cryobacterium frigoriphilum]TFD54018.1 ABC transporter ATP-binding protein [Cryobacterium frigoriphilum]
MEVHIEDLRLAYNGVPAIRDLSLTIGDGESIVLLGQSGCGKTSTMRCVAGLEEPTGGSIRIGERTVFDAVANVNVPSHKRNVGMVFQSYAVWPHKTVLENVIFPLRMKKVGRRQARADGLKTLELVGLGHLADRGASLLSGGQMQRGALARSMAMKPSVLMLDEPLSNLDARLRDDLRVELRRIQVEQGLTSLYVTHDQQEALALADRIAIMRDGIIAQLGTPQQIYSTPASAAIASFLGVTNVFPVTSTHSANRVTLIEHPLELAVDEPIEYPESSACIRPDDIDVRPRETRIGERNRFAGEVTVAVFQGASIRYQVKLTNGPVIDAICPQNAHGVLAVGSSVDVSIDPSSIMVLPNEVPEVRVSERVAA